MNPLCLSEQSSNIYSHTQLLKHGKKTSCRLHLLILVIKKSQACFWKNTTASQWNIKLFYITTNVIKCSSFLLFCFSHLIYTLRPPMWNVLCLQPFFHLRLSGFWSVTIPPGLFEKHISNNFNFIQSSLQLNMCSTAICLFWEGRSSLRMSSPS